MSFWGHPDHHMECIDCDNLLRQYEFATFAVSRAVSSLDIAERMYDLGAIERLTMEAHNLTARQRDARAALAGHRNTPH
jgi:hypothetical protein